MLVSSDTYEDVSTLPRPLVLLWDLGMAWLVETASTFCLHLHVVKALLMPALESLSFLSFLCFSLFCVLVCVCVCVCMREKMCMRPYTHIHSGGPSKMPRLRHCLLLLLSHWPGAHPVGCASRAVNLRGLSVTLQHGDCTYMSFHLSFLRGCSCLCAKHFTD